jgi:hypothetical protein
VSEQARKKDHCTQSTVQEKQRSGIHVHTCWNELKPCRAWITYFGRRVVAHPPAILAVTAPKNPCRQFLSSMQEVHRGLLEDHEQYHTKHWWKIFAGSLVRVFHAGFYLPKHGCMALDNTLSSKGRLIYVEHDAGELRLCSTALEKPLTKLLLPGVVYYAHCLNFLPMIRVQLLLMHDLPNSSLRCMHGVPNLACAGWQCVSNHNQDRFLKPWSADSPPPIHNHVGWQVNQSLLAADLWIQTCCGAEAAD